MAHSHQKHTSGADQGPLYGAVAISFLVACALLYGFIASAPEVTPVTEASFAPTPLEIDEKLLDAQRRRLIPEVDLQNPQVVIFQSAMRKANILQFEKPDPQAIRDAEVAVEFAANDAASSVGGYDAFVEFARPLYHACQTELARALDAIASGSVTLEVMTTSPPPEFNVYRETCGNVLPILVGTGLVTEDGKWRDSSTGPVVFEILSRLRIAYIIHLRRPALSQLTPYEQEILWRWRIDDEYAYPEKERLKYLNRALSVTKDDAYPTPLDAAKAYYRAGRKTAARDVLQTWCAKKKDDAQLQNYCVFLATKTAPTGTPKK